MIDSLEAVQLPNRLFFSYKEFASIIGVHDRTIYRWVKAGHIKIARFGLRCVKIPRGELERFMRGEMMEPRKEENALSRHEPEKITQEVTE